MQGATLEKKIRSSGEKVIVTKDEGLDNLRSYLSLVLGHSCVVRPSPGSSLSGIWFFVLDQRRSEEA